MPHQHQFVVSWVDLDTDWDEFMLAHWKSWTTPLQASGELTFPYLGSNTPEEAAAFDMTKNVLLAEAKDNPETVFWIKGIEQTTGKIAGGACFKLEKEWPTSGTNFTGCGFESGSERQQLSDSFYRQLLAWRLRLMKGKHMYGQCFFVLPEYRATGVGRQMLEFGVAESDRLGVDSFLEGTIFSTPGCLRVGFIVIGWTNMVFTRQNPSRDWKRLVHALQAHPISIMWRPKQGVYIEGETVLPWESQEYETVT